MIEQGEVKDPNYVIQPNGKAKFIFGKGRKGAIEISDVVTEKPENAKPVKKKRATATKKRKKTDSEDDDEDDDDDEEFKPSAYERSSVKKRVTRSSSSSNVASGLESTKKKTAKKSKKGSDESEDESENQEFDIKNENPLPGFVDPITLGK